MSEQHTREATQLVQKFPELRGLTYSSGVLDTRFGSLLDYKRDIETNRAVIEGLDKTSSLNVVNHYIWLHEHDLQTFKAKVNRNRSRQGWKIVAVTALIVALTFAVPALFGLVSSWFTGTAGSQPPIDTTDSAQAIVDYVITAFQFVVLTAGVFVVLGVLVRFR